MNIYKRYNWKSDIERAWSRNWFLCNSSDIQLGKYFSVWGGKKWTLGTCVYQNNEYVYLNIIVYIDVKSQHV